MARKTNSSQQFQGYVKAISAAVNKVILTESKLVEVVLEYTSGATCSPERIYHWADHVRQARRHADIERAALAAAQRQAVRDGVQAIQTSSGADTDANDSGSMGDGPEPGEPEGLDPFGHSGDDRDD